MSDTEKMPGMNSFVLQKIFWDKKDETYAEHIELMLSNFQQLGCNMSIKVDFLRSHLDRFPENLGDLSEGRGERQAIQTMEERYQGHWNAPMMNIVGALGTALVNQVKQDNLIKEIFL